MVWRTSKEESPRSAAEIREVLNNGLAAAADGAGVVKGFCVGVNRGERETVTHALLQP